ncbi:sensor histidine kinase [Fibrella sp. HMF5335]|uniref:Sensor histidine kinase n=1 Tax=Fibrella rubiginis TaxID=2817060 RepID=A0A939GEY2_9BACT|nr:sensor histidine kinase [Fibrella rubiginis]MBO0936245.1 sensor histidine kinase [Fibrella rubiginis]
MKYANDIKIRLFGPPALFLFGTTFFRLNWYFEFSLRQIIKTDIIAISAGYICWELTRRVVLAVQRRYPSHTQTRTRITWLALALPVLANFGWFIRKVAHTVFDQKGWYWPTAVDYTSSLGIQFFYHCVYMVIYEGGYVLRQWQQTYVEKEALVKANLQSQLDSLKNQINPHFLFNNLNSLSSLISENPRQAEAFVDEISSVYRYLLRSNEFDLTTLRNELAFIDSYFHLLKTRYTAGIELHIFAPEHEQGLLLPPLTLQVLVENAVKHNIILAEQPLHIEILARDGSLIVRNNLQRKSTSVVSNRVGLANIATKYQLLGTGGIDIREEASSFVVTLPLLAASTTDHPTMPPFVLAGS